MHPILIDFGWRTLPFFGRVHLYIGTYGVVFAAAVLIGWILWIRIARRDGFDIERHLDLGFYALLAGLMGSKIGLILTDPQYYLSSLSALATTIRAAGVLLFGVVAAIVTVLLYTRRHRLSFWGLLDTIAPSMALGQALGRLGCFAVGCCYGKRAPGLPWGVCFTDPASAALSGTPLYDPNDPEKALNILHPVQLYQAGADVLLFLVLLLVSRHKVFTGRTSLLFIVFYSISRFVIEFFRGDEVRGLFGIPGTSILLSTSQWISLGGLVVVAIAWPRLSRRGVVPFETVSEESRPADRRPRAG